MKYTGLTSKSIDLWGDTTAKLKVVNVRSNFLDENILTRIYVCCSYYCFFYLRKKERKKKRDFPGFLDCALRGIYRYCEEILIDLPRFSVLSISHDNVKVRDQSARKSLDLCTKISLLYCDSYNYFCFLLRSRTNSELHALSKTCLGNSPAKTSKIRTRQRLYI